MRVLIVQPALIAYGGAAAAIAHLSDYLNSKGIKNTVLSLVVTDYFIRSTSSLSSLNIKYRLLSHLKYEDTRNFMQRLSSVFSDVALLRRYIKMLKNNYDLINPHNFPAHWASILQGKPVVWMMNEPPDVYSMDTLPLGIKVIRDIGVRIDKILVKKHIDQICVNSYLTYNQAKERYEKLPEIVFFGIDYEKYCKGSPDKVIERFGLEGRFVVLTSGGLNPQKNQLASVKAIEIVKNYIPNIKLVLAGGGEKWYINMLRRYIASKKLDFFVTFTGFLSDVELRNLYHASHIGLYPFKEQGGLMAPFEHLCAGKPIIISSINGAAEIIKRHKFGIVTDDYAKAIINVYDNYKHYEIMAQKAKEFIKEELSWEKYSQRLLKVFEKCYNRWK